MNKIKFVFYSHIKDIINFISRTRGFNPIRVWPTLPHIQLAFVALPVHPFLMKDGEKQEMLNFKRSQRLE